MPLYYFNLKQKSEIICDPEGTELADETEARAYATEVAQELMQNQQTATAAWRLQVCDAAHSPQFELLFATLDNAHLPREFRRTLIGISSNFASLYDTITDLRATLRQIDGDMERARGTLHLAALNGRRLDSGAPER